jgi:hypothetical protein
MRAGIRKALIDNIPELTDCFEPTVPGKDTLKPYAVVLQGNDVDNGDTIGFKRTIEIWIYEKRTTFKKLDILTKKVKDCLDFETIIDENEAFTCIYEGAAGQDVVDEEWDCIARGLSFSVIALYEDTGEVSDTWVEALSKYTNELLGINVYKDNWKMNFVAPCALWRVTDVEQERVNYDLVKIDKTLKCHIVSKNKDDITNLLDMLETQLIIDKRVQLNERRMFLKVDNVKESRDADMFTTGQLTVSFTLLGKIKRDIPTLNHMYGRGSIN